MHVGLHNVKYHWQAFQEQWINRTYMLYGDVINSITIRFNDVSLFFYIVMKINKGYSFFKNLDQTQTVGHLKDKFPCKCSTLKQCVWYILLKNITRLNCLKLVGKSKCMMYQYRVQMKQVFDILPAKQFKIL